MKLIKINWKVRLRNKVWLAAMLATIIAFVFDVLALCDVIPAVTEGSQMDHITTLLPLLPALGVVIDPTTDGPSDSPLALTYE